MIILLKISGITDCIEGCVRMRKQDSLDGLREIRIGYCRAAIEVGIYDAKDKKN